MGSRVMISLGDRRLKEVAEVLGSKSCVRILELLGEVDLSVSDIASRLKMRLNTVDYNVKKLVRAGLIEKGGHWWSVKGRRIETYRVANRDILISPRAGTAKKFLWVLGLTGIGALLIKGLNFGSDKAGVFMEDAVFDAAPKAAGLMAEAVPEAEMMASNAGLTQRAVDVATEPSFWGSLAGWEWFLIGAWSVVVLFFIYSLIAERRGR